MEVEEDGSTSDIPLGSRKIKLLSVMFVLDLIRSVEGPNVGRIPRLCCVSTTSHTQPLVNMPRAAAEKVDFKLGKPP